MKKKKAKRTKNKSSNNRSNELLNRLVDENVSKIHENYIFDMLHLAARLEGRRAGPADIAALAQRYGLTISQVEATLPPPLPMLGLTLKA